eukprot:scaffold47243_cov14-Prasinocladus_malaysianus.AAC.1
MVLKMTLRRHRPTGTSTDALQFTRTSTRSRFDAHTCTSTSTSDTKHHARHSSRSDQVSVIPSMTDSVQFKVATRAGYPPELVV